MEELRKVIYSFEEENLEYGMFDLNEEEKKEAEELHKKRPGLFHQLGDEIITEEDGAKFQKTVAIIEDSETHKVCKIDPKLIQFI